VKRKIEEFSKQFIVLKTRKKLRIIIVVGLVVGAVKLIFCDFQQSELILKFDTFNVELGKLYRLI
jgi:cell division protein FtsL